MHEAAAAACRDCRAKVKAYVTVDKHAVMRWHEEPEWLTINDVDT